MVTTLKHMTRLPFKKSLLILAAALLAAAFARKSALSSSGSSKVGLPGTRDLDAESVLGQTDSLLTPVMIGEVVANHGKPVAEWQPQRPLSASLGISDLGFQLPEPPQFERESPEIESNLEKFDRPPKESDIDLHEPEPPHEVAGSITDSDSGTLPDTIDELTEQQARERVMQLFGGPMEFAHNESDLAHAYAAARRALKRQGIQLNEVPALAIIDFTLPSYENRLAIYDPRSGRESRHLVAHGSRTGKLKAQVFSNIPGSNHSSPGLYRVGEHYDGKHGAALRLHGLEPGVNDRAFQRNIVLHAAWYVSYKTILENQIELGVPRIGRSQGCPAVSAHDLSEILEKLKPGSFLYIYPVPPPFPEFPEVRILR